MAYRVAVWKVSCSRSSVLTSMSSEGLLRFTVLQPSVLVGLSIPGRSRNCSIGKPDARDTVLTEVEMINQLNCLRLEAVQEKIAQLL